MLDSKYNSLLKFTAICSILGAVTTALLIFLPNPPAASFEERALLFDNSRYIMKLWILFIHPQVNLMASFGIAFLLFQKYPLRITVGMLFLFVWAITEITQQALLIDALNQMWRPGYVNAETELDKGMYHTLLLAANGISDSKYFLVIYGFGLGSLMFGLAIIQEVKLGKAIGVALIFIGVLSLASFLRYYAGFSSLNSFANLSYQYIYPYLQPAVRIGIGVWIYQQVIQRPDPTHT